MRFLSFFLLFSVALSGAPSSTDQFQKTVQPFIAKNCLLCHSAKAKSADLNLEKYNDSSALDDRDLWERIVQRVRNGEMPPKGMPRPAAKDIEAVTNWIEAEYARIDKNTKPDPGRVTARRLNKAEYNNTIRDLLAVNFHPADDFPPDDSGYGFDNIGDVLSLSPVLMEKYLNAADQIVRMAIASGPLPKAYMERHKLDEMRKVGSRGEVQACHRFAYSADFELQVGVGGRRLRTDENALQPLEVAVFLDGKQIKTFELDPNLNKPRTFTERVPVEAGEHQIAAALIDPPDAPETDHYKRDRNFVIDYIEVRGPYAAKEPLIPASRKRIFICGDGDGKRTPECARTIITALARRAYRRPVTAKEVNGLLRFVDLAQAQGDSFEQGIGLAIKAILVSPHFLFRIEHDARPDDPKAAHTINDFELATRLSYFLWSSMPDEELLRAAETKSLHKPAVLNSQVRRMLKDPKSEALADNFAGQWLQLRNLDTIKPDPERFPGFDDSLRDAMRQETRLFFDSIIHEDRSILDFIDGKYTFLNERLAKHYGIPGIKGSDFRRVELTGDQRSGVLTQASVLTVSSYPTRTSAVLRGKWLLENILNAPPPPPPPNVANLDEAAVGVTGTFRQQLEKHRSSPMCASCHTRMDPLGFGLENYDAIGKWRTVDGKFPVDASGTLPGGKSFTTPAQLKEILRSEKDEFADCLTEKLLTYGLGRGLERYDKNTVHSVVKDLSAKDYKFSELVIDIVNSMPFQMRRGDGGKT